jgi:tetratricopeptide (TPR) repeat protein/SAM-dependent methyltransferase
LTQQELQTPPSTELRTLVDWFNGGRQQDALTLAKSLTVRFPNHGFGWMVLGTIYLQMGRHSDAQVPMQNAATLRPNDAGVHGNLGIVFDGLGQTQNAILSYQRAIAINPGFSEAHYNLGQSLQGLGQLDAAATSYRRALEIDPSNLSASCAMGDVLRLLRRYEEAISSYNAALKIKPDAVDVLNRIALVLQLQGKSEQALGAIRTSLHLRETEEAKYVFIDCLKRVDPVNEDPALRPVLTRALIEVWARPGDISRLALRLVKRQTNISSWLVRSKDSRPAHTPADAYFAPGELAAVADDALIIALLKAAPICNIDLERFFVNARHAMLATLPIRLQQGEDSCEASLTRLYCAMAMQCFINEYVYPFAEEEIHTAELLRHALTEACRTQGPVSGLVVAAVAAYFPLGTVAHAEYLSSLDWPEEIRELITQQILEPAQERRLGATLRKLGQVHDGVSLRVQLQYEENPYPRWNRTGPIGAAKNIGEYLTQKFPQAPTKLPHQSQSFDVLIAGCGTGYHSAVTAQRFPRAKILAVDLSIASLSYAKRKTQEMQIDSIEYAQADILQMADFGLRFDHIEAVGVLHHLGDPWVGWQTLLSILNLGGSMRLGFYSAVARTKVTEIRKHIALEGHAATGAAIRNCRQMLAEPGNPLGFTEKSITPDFFTLSECRDLLFHVQEHCLTLPAIHSFIKDNHLTFLGFEVAPDILRAYAHRFPQDLAATDLNLWSRFEEENPSTFFGMYQFWVQKNH